MSLYLICFLLTQLIELAVAFIWSLAVEHYRRDGTSLLIMVAGINGVTHPVAWMIFGLFPESFLLIEVIVIGVEAAILRLLPGFSTVAAISLSAAMNIASGLAGIGVVMWWLSTI